ncbi:Aminopeptidase N precursor [Reticulomyxa filosa]|uniref:Aminopeptidase N n=1 Tax=Reticulomyxa filosa TaxID=46433 RepID=X6MI55_RETFI|nr:Aminopeptidase N precursor [Reticulomyxa filosa]|eukprot:ETO13693.1 Aminopeptidase N precursor [Reticulomyxa filosa]
MKLRIGNETITVLLEKKKQIVDLPKNTKWVHLNADSIGFYACQYDKTLMESLTHALRSGDKNLNISDKICLVRDTLAIAQAGNPQATENLLNLIASFENETSYSIWFTILDAAQAVFHIINDDDVLAQQFKALMRKVLLPVFKKIDWQGDKDEDEETQALLRPLILSAMSKYGYQPVIDEALKRFKAFINLNDEEKKTDGQKAYLAPALRNAVYSIAIKYGGKEEFDTLQKYYLSTTDSSEQGRALRALALTTNPDIIPKLLEWIKDSDKIRNHDRVLPFSIVAQGIAGREMAWQMLQKTFDQWYSMFEGGFLGRDLVKIPSSFVSFEKADEIEKFYKTLDYPACKRSMDQCVETIRKNANWKKQTLGVISKWANSQSGKD